MDTHWKLALLAKEGIQLDNLLNDPPATVTYPPEPTYEEPVENHTQATERDRKVRNQQLKVNWQNRCKKWRRLEYCVEISRGEFANKKRYRCCI